MEGTDLVYRLRAPQTEKAAISPREHGDLRRRQGYTVAMMVEESGYRWLRAEKGRKGDK
jgi:hypothetical protein